MVRALTSLCDWLDKNRAYVFELVRTYLGIALVVKGLQFVRDDTFLASVLTQTETMDFIPTAILHYIPLAHLGGGVLLALGLLTRLSALVQVPILLGAAFVVYLPDSLLSYSQDFEFTVLVLFLLLAIVVHGGGPLSLDCYVARSSRRRVVLASPQAGAEAVDSLRTTDC